MRTQPKLLWALVVGVLTVCLVAADRLVKSPSAKTPTTKESQSITGDRHKVTTDTIVDGVLIGRKEAVDLGPDGSVDLIFSKLYENGTLVFAETEDKKRRKTVRSYYSSGKMIAEEADEDFDGSFEILIIFDLNEQPSTGFLRRSNEVTRLDAERLKLIKEAFSLGASISK